MQNSNGLMNTHYDVIIAGGGLAGGLLAYRLISTQSHLKILLLESGSHLGGNHTWSFHGSDLNESEMKWVRPFIGTSWSGYSVHFPKYSRHFDSSYHSIQSNHFHNVISKTNGLEVRYSSKVKELDAESVTLEGGEVFLGKAIIDARGDDSQGEPCGYQKFVGMELVLEQSHGLKNPIIMDATCAQDDGYRFFYCLPWNSQSLLIEDTYYSDSAIVNDEKFKNEIRNYAFRKGWKIKAEGRVEVGALPIPFSKTNLKNNIPAIGARAGLFHPTTGYSFAEAVRLADRIVQLGNLTSENLYSFLKHYQNEKMEQGSFFRFLNRMLFFAALPEGRLIVMQRFYRLSEGLIQRFYSGKTTFFDRARILMGRPPVNVLKAAKCIVNKKEVSFGN